MDKEALQPIRDEDYFTATKAGFEIHLGQKARRPCGAAWARCQPAEITRIIRGASGRSWGFRLFQRVEIEDDVFDALVAQVSFERRHDAASPRQYRGANNIVRGGSPAGKELAVENAMQVRRNLSRGEPSPAVAAVAVHFE